MPLAVTVSMVIAGRYILSIVRLAESVKFVNARELATVIVSVPLLVVMEMPEPAANVNVSELVSATTDDCPATSMVLKTDALFVIVITSRLESVVICMPLPAASVRVSVLFSATTVD